jgi:hypothetical protein
MTKVEIIENYKMMKKGDTPNLDDAYAAKLIEKKVAKKFVVPEKDKK